LKFLLLIISATFLVCFPLAGSSDTPNQSFSDWLVGIKVQAKEKGISENTIRTLDNLEPDPRVLKFDKKQPEFVQTFEEYLTARVTDYRIKKGRKYYRDNQEELEKIAHEYQVDAAFLVAFWGLESNFGTYQGKYSIVRSLATLAHDPRRTTFFTKELFKALQILDEGHISKEKFVGGWAGAMGQNQFMPSSFLNYAQDFDGDGKKNIWSNQSDVWASIANYLSKNRWRQGEIWGLVASIEKPVDYDSLKPEKKRSGCRAFRHHTKALSLADWDKLGVKVEGRSEDLGKYAMVKADEGESTGYLVGPNFRGILAYNCANKYAVSVGLLADKIIL
jgi:membrane-bound lytic murein transglycosylase B